ncbi:MAG: GTPase [Desulfobacterales bacterium]|nr:GTPase [Desulfobacterales bacterium]
MNQEELSAIIDRAKDEQSTELDLSNSNITRMPREIAQLTGLRKLDLSCNQLEELPGAIVQLSSLTHLFLGLNRLCAMPEEIVQMRSLSLLDLSENRLNAIPKEIMHLSSLNLLDLSENDLEEMPEGILQLDNLTQLYLSSNKLRELPKEIARLSNLARLYLSSNQLRELPGEIARLSNLTLLDLSSNMLLELPGEIENLSNLTRLYLSSNKLRNLPAQIAQLSNLTLLDLSSNRIKELPKEIGHLSSLTLLDLRGNPVVFPPERIINQGTKAVINYFEALLKERIKIWAGKMVIVGEGAVGKSCLLDSLGNRRYDPHKSTTHGIDIRTLSFPHPGTEDITMKLNTWDFGGQDIYHATHQFYLTDNSVFLLVWNAIQGFEAGKVYKWLETIHALAPNAPIFVIATHSLPRGADLPKDELSALYPNIVGFFEIDNESRYGLPELTEQIRKIASNLKYMGVEQPKTWIDASSAIKKLEQKYIAKQDLFSILKGNGVSETNLENLAIYLHELGEILYYPDEEELQNTIIIKPQWVSQYIAKVLDSPEVSRNNGFLKKQLMQEIWKDLDSDLQEKFLVLMEKFDLSYKTSHDREVSLVVEKSKYEEDTRYKIPWQERADYREIIMKFEISAIPAGIPTWFIARTHRFTRYIHWRNGVLLEDQDKKHLGLLIANPNKKEVWLMVRGIVPNYFFALLRDTLELTFARFEGLEIIRKIPCPGHNREKCSHEFDLNDLERRLEKKPPKLEIECPKSMEDVSVPELLFGLSDTTHKDLVNKIKETVARELQGQNQELIKLLQLEFLNLYKSQQKIMDMTCPNVFTLKPRDQKWLTRNISAHEFELQLYCQKPGAWHPIEDGKYTVIVPKKWMISLGHYCNKIAKYLRWFTPAFQIPEIGELGFDSHMFSESRWGSKLDLMNGDSEIPEDESEPHRASVAELRLIRKILEDADPSGSWGGLERVVTPEGYILWLCPEHKAEYEI